MRYQNIKGNHTEEFIHLAGIRQIGYKVEITVVRQIKSKSSTNSPYLLLIHFKHTLSILEVHRTNRTVSVSPLLGRRYLAKIERDSMSLSVHHPRPPSPIFSHHFCTFGTHII